MRAAPEITEVAGTGIEVLGGIGRASVRALKCARRSAGYWGASEHTCRWQEAGGFEGSH